MLVTGCAQLPVLLGSLLVAITGLPLGIAAGVTVTGPSAFNEILNATTLLSNVTAGSYSLSASTLNPADPIVTATFLVDAIDSDVEVSASATAVANVRYLRDRGSGALWVAHSAGVSIAVSGFDCNQLATGVALLPRFQPPLPLSVRWSPSTARATCGLPSLATTPSRATPRLTWQRRARRPPASS